LTKDSIAGGGDFHVGEFNVTPDCVGSVQGNPDVNVHSERRHPPQKYPFPWGSGSHLIRGSLHPSDSTPTAGSLVVQPFLHSTWLCQAHRHTDRHRKRPRYVWYL